MSVGNHVRSVTDDARFMAKVEVHECGCWLWRGALMHNGYGQTWRGGRNRPAHRYAYEVEHGPVPSELDMDHLCRNRACVNPTHLEPVTRSENLRRGMKRGEHCRARTHCPYGHSYSPDNTRVTKAGTRACRTCDRRRAQRNRDAARMPRAED